MPAPSTPPPRLRNTPEWVFPWRGRKRTIFPYFVGWLVASLGLSFLLGSVRIKVTGPKPLTPRKASMIYLTDDAQGRALALKARQEGPFPSRFDPAQWEGMAGLQQQVLELTRIPRPAYSPQLRELPKEAHDSTRLAPVGETFFPDRAPVLSPPAAGPMLLQPSLYPLSGTDSLPEKLPAFQATLDPAAAAASWRFLLRVNAAGTVIDCVSLGKGGEKGATELENWLRSSSFKPNPGTPPRWIALGIGFSNLPTHGPDAP